MGEVRFLGGLHPVCRRGEKGAVIATASARYSADSPAEAILVLVTRPSRLARDLAAFRRVAASTRPCSTIWYDGKDRRKTSVAGTGPRCPAAAKFF